MAADIVAKESFFVATRKGVVPVVEGRTYDKKHEGYRRRPDAFVPLEEWAEKQSRVFTYVEAATAAPGETRTVKKPAVKKAAAKKPAVKKSAVKKAAVEEEPVEEPS